LKLQLTVGETCIIIIITIVIIIATCHSHVVCRVGKTIGTCSALSAYLDFSGKEQSVTRHHFIFVHSTQKFYASNND